MSVFQATILDEKNGRKLGQVKQATKGLGQESYLITPHTFCSSKMARIGDFTNGAVAWD